MAERITDFMVALIFAGMVIAGFGIFMTHGVNKYNIEGFDSSSMETYDQLEELNTQARTLSESTTQIREKTGLLDVIGGIFSSAFQTLLTARTAFDTFLVIGAHGVESVPLGDFTTPIRNAIIGAVMIIFFIGILLSLILKGSA